MVDLYNCADKYEKRKEGIEEWQTAPENKAAVRRYCSNYLEHLSDGRKLTDLSLLKNVFNGTKVMPGPLIEKPLGDLTLEDFEAIRKRMQQQIRTRDTFKKISLHIRRILEQEFEDDKNPERQALHKKVLADGRKRYFKWPNKAPENLSIDDDKYYTEEEFLKLLQVSKRPIERALLAVAFEGTARPNEYLSILAKDVTEKPDCFQLKAHISKRKGGATKTRQLAVVTFRKEFNEWWRAHPYHATKNASLPLFYREDGEYLRGVKKGKPEYHPLGPRGFDNLIKRLDKRSGVNKKGSAYFFRRGGYTWKRLNGMNDALAGADMGWTPGSSEARKYAKFQDDEVLAERRRLAGVTVKREERAPPKVKICPFCNAENGPVERRCVECGNTLSMTEVMAELHQMRAQMDRLASKYVKEYQTLSDSE